MNNNISKPLILGLGLTAASLAQEESHQFVPVNKFTVPEGLEVTVWAKSPMFYNPTNMDMDYKGRIWVAEGRAYRTFKNKFASEFAKTGDRIMVLEDADKDGKAEKSHVFVQDPDLIAPLGIAVIDNKVVVSQPPSIIVYHDVDRNGVFDAKIDKKETFLTGFGGKDHDHSLHAVTTGPTGQWYFNVGNAGTHVIQDKEGFTIKAGSSYRAGSPSVQKKGPNQGGKPGLVSDDGHVYVGAVALRVNADGTGLRVIAHNMRNSYEETVTSFGDVFQNDNDDPPACRVSWVMEYSNFGFSSDDGKRTWTSDRRPGQTSGTAHWRQDDPGKTPAGDIYGNGSPTGITFYENGALGEKWNGLLLSAEAARNVIFGYQPKPMGAGFELKRTDFFKSGTDAVSTSFRPSDVTIGADGCIYVADWFDEGVGGHRTADKSYSGTIYRIAPKGENPLTPEIDLATTEGQIAALKSPAINVRNLGFTRLKAQGEKAIDAVKALLENDSNFIKARALFLLAQMGDKGIAEVKQFMQGSTDEQLKIACFRALRFIDHEVLEMCKQFSKENSVALRREAALALRNYTWADAGSILYDLAVQYDGKDRWYLEAIGTGAAKKEKELYKELVTKFETHESTKWSLAMARLAWRLHPEESVEALKARALDTSLSKELRIETLTAIGYIGSEAAALSMVQVAEEGGAVTEQMSRWWLNKKSSGAWSEFKGKMKGFDKKLNPLPTNVDYLIGLDAEPVTSPLVEEVVKLQGDPVMGQGNIASCYQCHSINGVGQEFGPTLSQWGAGRSIKEIADAIINPNSGIAHGFTGTEIKMKSGNTIQGISLSGEGKAKQLVIRVKAVPIGEVELNSKNVVKRKTMERSLMLSAGQLGLTSQQVANIAAYLQKIGKENTK